MEKREYLEDCLGCLWEREQIPAEHDVYPKMKPVWKKLFYSSGYYAGRLLYEGFTVDGMAYGAGTFYYGSGGKYQEGLFGPNGLICGREYYINGQLRFEGTYQYNPDFSLNWPVFGAYYSAAGELKYYGTFDVIGTGDEVIHPLVMVPEDYGPVAEHMIDKTLFRGDKILKYYEISEDFREKVREREKEKLRTTGSAEKKLKRLRILLNHPCPEYRAFAEEEIRGLEEWTERDQEALDRARRRCRPPRTGVTPEQRYRKDLEILAIPDLIRWEESVEIDLRDEAEQNALFSRFSNSAEGSYPYRWGKDPRHGTIGEPLEKRGINLENWLRHLDEMTDREISYMLDQEIGTGRREEDRIVHPEASEREYAEFMRDFGL